MAGSRRSPKPSRISPLPRLHTIWEIVNHVRFWHEVVTLQRNTEPWQLLHGLIAHTAYHTAQIIMLRRLQGIWIVDWRERAEKIY